MFSLTLIYTSSLNNDYNKEQIHAKFTVLNFIICCCKSFHSPWEVCPKPVRQGCCERFHQAQALICFAGKNCSGEGGEVSPWVFEKKQFFTSGLHFENK